MKYAVMKYSLKVIAMSRKIEIPTEELQQLRELARKASRYDLMKAIDFMILKHELETAVRQMMRKREIKYLARELKIPWVITDEQK